MPWCESEYLWSLYHSSMGTELFSLYNEVIMVSIYDSKLNSISHQIHQLPTNNTRLCSLNTMPTLDVLCFISRSSLVHGCIRCIDYMYLKDCQDKIAMQYLYFMSVVLFDL